MTFSPRPIFCNFGLDGLWRRIAGTGRRCSHSFEPQQRRPGRPWNPTPARRRRRRALQRKGRLPCHLESLPF